MHNMASRISITHNHPRINMSYSIQSSRYGVTDDYTVALYAEIIELTAQY